MNEIFWTLTEMAPGAATRWEIALPNGIYNVRVVAGGPINFGDRQRVTVEGVSIVDEPTGDYAPWVAGTQSVTVEDGRLSMQNAPGAASNRVCFITIQPRGAS